MQKISIITLAAVFAFVCGVMPVTASAATLNVSGGGTGLTSVANGMCLAGSSNAAVLKVVPCFATTTAYTWSKLQTFAAGIQVQGTATSTFAGNVSIAGKLKLGSQLLARFSNVFNHRAYVVCAESTIITAGCDYVADGVADNIEIQQAYDAASALGGDTTAGGEVILSSGRFDLAAPIRLNENNVTIKGAGIDATTLFITDGANVNAIEYTETADIMFNSLQGFTIDGNRDANTKGYGVYIKPSGTNHFWDFYVRDVWAKNMSNDGFYSYDGHGFVLDHFLSEYNDGDGVRFDGIDAPEVQNGTFKFNGGNGITCNNNSCLVQSNEVSDNTGYGIEMSGVSGTASNNTVYMSGLSGIHVTQQAFIRVTNNIVKNNMQHGILVDTSDAFISGNSVFENSQQAAGAFDEINAAHFRSNVSNNSIDGRMQSRYGINFDASWGSGNISMNNTIVNEVTAPTNDVAENTAWFNGGNNSTIITEPLSLKGISDNVVGNYLCVDPTTKQVSFGTTCTMSSERFKENIKPIADGALSEILALKPVSYTFKQGYGDSGKATQLGFIAENAVTVDPRLVPLDKDGLPSGFMYQNFTAVITKAIQELTAQVVSINPSATSTGGTLMSSLTGTFSQWLSDSQNSLGDLFAGKVHTKEICVQDSTGETCVTRAQLNALLAGTTATASVTESVTIAPPAPSVDASTGGSSTTDSTTTTSTDSTTTDTATTPPDTTTSAPAADPAPAPAPADTAPAAQ